MDVEGLVDAIRRRDSARAEAQLQADIYRLLVSGALALGEGDVVTLETPTQDGSRRRLDIQVGHCCIEVKKDLRVGNVLTDARAQLAGYVHQQAGRYGTRYVGILTDGAEWHLHRLDQSGTLLEVAVLDATRSSADEVLIWLESVLATSRRIPATAKEIQARLGVDSPGHVLDHSTLAGLYEQNRQRPEVQVKRDLWAKLLRTAFGTSFNDTPDLFLDHTLLVLTAEAIAHAVAGFDLTTDGLSAADIARGTRFHDAQIHGVVEADFFDWILDADGGPSFLLDLVRRIARFDWATATHHDVLKTLYTSIISPQIRESLGEYYTPEWLADRMVADVYTDPLNQRLLEPSCGSGTFLMHAVRAHLHAAEASGMSAGEAIGSVTQNVIGMDIHPVSVALARVSYLMAIGRDRLRDPSRGPMTVPVYLGDSMQWEQHTDLFAGVDDVTVSTSGDDLVGSGGGALFGDELRFPFSVLQDAAGFDRLITEMADAAVDPTRDKTAAAKVMRPILHRRGIAHDGDQALLIATYDTLRDLHRTGRNHIWGYYVRNLIRPLWVSHSAKVDVLIGNPPWLRYSKMTAGMQQRYKALAQHRGLLTGGLGASARDLSTVFVARTIELYLRNGGRFAFVMPHGVMSRRPHAGFRTGTWQHKGQGLRVAFDQPWDLEHVTTGFPMTSCVVRGTRQHHDQSAKKLPAEVLAWSGSLPRNGDVEWDLASSKVTTQAGTVADTSSRAAGAQSPYRALFRDGAILYPRVLLFVEEQATASSPLGVGAGRAAVTSARSSQEKPPWKTMPSLTGTVERASIHDIYLGESIAPYRALPPRRGVLPLTRDRIMTPDEIEDRPGLSQWWRQVEDVWEQGRKSNENQPLLTRFDYHKQLSSQLPTATHRVLYSASGNTLSAARLSESLGVIEHKLYWAAVTSAAEARYLIAILNSRALLERVRPLQARGLFGARDFDKYVFHVPFPVYDAGNDDHAALARLAGEAERVAAEVDLPPGIRFTQTRQQIRVALDEAQLSEQIERTVERIVAAT